MSLELEARLSQGPPRRRSEDRHQFCGTSSSTTSRFGWRRRRTRRSGTNWRRRRREEGREKLGRVPANSGRISSGWKPRRRRPPKRFEGVAAVRRRRRELFEARKQAGSGTNGGGWSATATAGSRYDAGTAALGFEADNETARQLLALADYYWDRYLAAEHRRRHRDEEDRWTSTQSWWRQYHGGKLRAQNFEVTGAVRARPRSLLVPSCCCMNWSRRRPILEPRKPAARLGTTPLTSHCRWPMGSYLVSAEKRRATRDVRYPMCISQKQASGQGRVNFYTNKQIGEGFMLRAGRARSS